MIIKIDEGDFKQSINRAINKGNHVDYLKNVLKDFDDYEKFFLNVFTDKNPPHSVYSFKVNYLLKKPVWREFEICGVQEFDLFAEAITDSMEWYNDHMHGFSFPDSKQNHWQLNILPYTFYAPGWEDDPFPTYKSDQIRIENLDYKKFPKLRFEFDYGDGHLFDIEYLNIRPMEENEVVDEFPKVIDQRGVAPEQYPPCDL